MFQLTKSVDRDNGKTLVSITADGKDCETFVLKGKLAKKYIGFSLILEDLKNSEAWLKHAHSLLPDRNKSGDQKNIEVIYKDSIDEEISNLMKPLYYSTIITYGKCFAASTGRGVKLEHKDHIGSEFKSCHKEIINLRNNLVAHAGGAFDSGEVIVAPNPFGPEFHVTPNLWRVEFDDDREIEISYLDLISHVKSNVEIVLKKTLDRLLEHEARDAVIERNK
jgi:hypothetical protein